MPQYAVVTCADESMIPAACCALLSGRQKTAAQNVSYILVGVHVNKPCMDKINSFASKHEIPINFISYTSEHNDDTEFGRYSIASTARLDLGVIIPADYSRVLYIDADVLINDDLLQLFEMDLRGKSIGAVESVNLRGNDQARKAALGLPDNCPYFNSGVLLFDWPKTLAEGYLTNAKKLLYDKQIRRVSDQAALNAVIRGRLFLLPLRWNTKPFLFEVIKDIGIAHFVGSVKPWHKNCPLHFYKYRNTYKTYLDNTKFDDFVRRSSLSMRIRILIREVIRFLKRVDRHSRALELYNVAETRRRSLLDS